MRLLAAAVLVLAVAVTVAGLLISRSRHGPVQVQIQQDCAETFWGCGGSPYEQHGSPYENGN